MLPDEVDFDIDEDESDDLDEEEEPDKTYELDNYIDRIHGFCDGIEAVKQSVYHCLTTERYKYPIYSWDYGIETSDLIGKDPKWAAATLELRVNDALSQDDRIEEITDFTTNIPRRGVLAFSFNCVTKYGNFDYQGEIGGDTDGY